MRDGFYRAPMPGHMAATKSPTTGSRNRLPVDQAGNIDTTQTIPLLTQNGLDWGPWAITFDPMTTQGFATSPYPPQNGFGATGQPRAIVRFGVGGLTRVVEFDYPFAGGLVVVNTDRVEVAARAMRASAVAEGPGVGAWLTPASQQAIPTPVMMSNADSAAFAFVPGFARYLVVSPYMPLFAALPADELAVQFTGFGGSSVWEFRAAIPAGGLPEPYRVPVPPLATGVSIGFLGGLITNWSSFWEISLA